MDEKRGKKDIEAAIVSGVAKGVAKLKSMGVTATIFFVFI